MPLLFTREQIKRHLSELGFHNLPEHHLNVFIHDLKKLIKVEEKKHLERKARGEASPTTTYTTGPDQTSTSYNSTARDEDEFDAWKDSDGDEPSSFQDENYKPTPEKGHKPRPKTAAPVPSAAASSVNLKTQKKNPGRTTTAVDGKLKTRKPLAARSLEAESEPAPYSGSSSSSCNSLFGFEFGGSVDSDDDISAERKRVKNLPPESVRRDPVALYHYYKAFWDKQRAPGENPRMQLRWNVRAGTLGRVPCDPCGARVKYLR